MFYYLFIYSPEHLEQISPSNTLASIQCDLKSDRVRENEDKKKRAMESEEVRRQISEEKQVRKNEDM